MSSDLFTYLYNADYDPPMPVVEVGLSAPRRARPDQWVTALVDSGSDMTLIPMAILKVIGVRSVNKGYLRGILGQRQLVSLYLVTLYIGSHAIRGIRVVGLEEGDESILGRNVLNQLVVTLNGLASVTEIMT